MKLVNRAIRHNKITIGKIIIDYELVKTRRKSLEITVRSDKKIIVKAPILASSRYIKETIIKKAPWIQKKIAYFNQLPPRKNKEYINGELHSYLGRQYSLKIYSAITNKVLLKNDDFWIYSIDSEQAYIKKLLDDWYKKQAQVILPEIFDTSWEKFKKDGLEKPDLKLRMMKTRWGSCSSTGRVTLNQQLIKTPKECIEYVAIHELCHLIHLNHSPAFYDLLKKELPNWKELKQKLEIPTYH